MLYYHSQMPSLPNTTLCLIRHDIQTTPACSFTLGTRPADARSDISLGCRLCNSDILLTRYSNAQMRRFASSLPRIENACVCSAIELYDAVLCRRCQGHHEKHDAVDPSVTRRVYGVVM
jgi:hypothetical protein